MKIIDFDETEKELKKEKKIIEKKEKKFKILKKINSPILYIPLCIMSLAVLSLVLSIGENIIKEDKIQYEQQNFQKILTGGSNRFAIKSMYTEDGNLVIIPFMEIENYSNEGLNNTKNYYQIHFDNEEIISEGYLTNEPIIIPINEINLKDYESIYIDVYTIKNQEEIPFTNSKNRIKLETKAILEKQTLENCTQNDITKEQQSYCLDYININYINYRTTMFFPTSYETKVKKYNSASYKNQKIMIQKEIELLKRKVKLENEFYLSLGISQETINGFMEIKSYNDYYPFNEISRNKKQLDDYASTYASIKIVELEQEARTKNIDLTEYGKIKSTQTTIDNIKYLEEKLK